MNGVALARPFMYPEDVRRHVRRDVRAVEAALEADLEALAEDERERLES